MHRCFHNREKKGSKSSHGLAAYYVTVFPLLTHLNFTQTYLLNRVGKPKTQCAFSVKNIVDFMVGENRSAKIIVSTTINTFSEFLRY